MATAQPLAEVLWRSETEGKEFSTPERRAGLEAELARIVQAIRDPKIAEYYRQEFKERVFEAFRARRPSAGSPPMRSSAAKPWNRSGAGRSRGSAPEPVSAAVKRSLHAVNASGAARRMKERELMGLLLAAPMLIERHAELLAGLALSDPQLDRLKHELLHLAASGISLERTVVENHLVRQGMGVLAQRLQTQTVVQGVLQGAAEGAFKTSGEAAHEAAWRRAMAQLLDPEHVATGDLKARRDEALKRYLDGGAHDDWEELQRLNGLIRSASVPQ
jgi:DNA primase